jgi:hypothetical protein
MLAPALSMRCVMGDAARGGLSSLPRLILCRGLYENQLTGAIPDSLGSLSSLQYLCAPVRWLCAHARARAGDHAAATAMLAPALLLRCESGDIARWLSHVPLVFLCRYLQANQLTGAIPDSLGSLSSLEQLCAPVRWLCAHACESAGEHVAKTMIYPCAGTSTTTSSRARSRTRSARSQAFSICVRPYACCVRMRERWREIMQLRQRCLLRR